MKRKLLRTACILAEKLCCIQHPFDHVLMGRKGFKGWYRNCILATWSARIDDKYNLGVWTKGGNE